MIDFGLTPEQFRDRYFDRAPLLRRGALLTPQFSWNAVDDVLHVAEPTAPGFQLYRNGLVPEESFTDRAVEFGVPRRRLDQRRFYAELRAGATLVLNRVESHSPPAHRIVSAVSRFTGWPALGNAYLSFGGRGSFGKHWDTHDVFAVQLIGRKRWRVYAPTFPLPLAMHRSDASGQQCPATPQLDCVLEAGDLLYVPRGWWHETLPFEEPSFHLSVGTYAPAVHDYVLWAVARHLPAALPARRALTALAEPDTLVAALASLAGIVQDAARRAEFEREVAARARVGSAFDTELHLARGAALERGRRSSQTG